jgi:hypothetical protein
VASAVLLQGLGNGTLWDSNGNALNNHSVYVYERGTTTQVSVYTSAAMTTPLSQPLTTGANGANPGGIPGYVASGQVIDLYDSTASQRQPADPVAAADITLPGAGGPGEIPASILTGSQATPGNMGSAYTLEFSGAKQQMIHGTLDADLTITVDPIAAGYQALFTLTQDSTGGRTLTVSDGTDSEAVAIPTMAGTTTQVLIACTDGTNIDVQALGGLGGADDDSVTKDAIIDTGVEATDLGGLAASALSTASVSSLLPIHRQGLGIATDSSQWTMTTEELATDMALIASLGADAVRVALKWDQVQPTNGSSFTWTQADAIYDAADAQGLRVQFLLCFCPGWANGSESWNVPPTDPADYASFASACVGRYKDRGKYGCHWWEIENEPNNSVMFSDNTGYATYVSLLQAAYPVIKAADSTALVLLGGIAPGGTEGNTSGINLDTYWLTEVYAAGAQGYFDVLAYHSYGNGNDPLAGSETLTNGWTRISAIQALMATNGDGDKPIWLNEWGQATGTGTAAVTEALQAAYISHAFQRMREIPYVERAFVFCEYDSGTDTTVTADNWGLYHNDQVTAKPAAAVFRDSFNYVPVPATSTTLFKPVGFGPYGSTILAANEEYLAPLQIPLRLTLTGLCFYNEGTVNGNIVVTIRDAGGNLLGSSASTAQAGTYGAQFVAFSASQALSSGLYYIGIVSSSATGTYIMENVPGAGGVSAPSLTPASSVTLPVTATKVEMPALSTY